MKEWSFDYKTGTVGEWPETDGQPVPAVFLEHVFGSEPELALERNMLWAYGVPSVCQYPNGGLLGKLVLGESGCGADIFVPETMLEDAKNILSCDFSDIDIQEEE